MSHLDNALTIYKHSFIEKFLLTFFFTAIAKMISVGHNLHIYPLATTTQAQPLLAAGSLHGSLGNTSSCVIPVVHL
jgi:hypothetical protein